VRPRNCGKNFRLCQSKTKAKSEPEKASKNIQELTQLCPTDFDRAKSIVASIFEALEKSPLSKKEIASYLGEEKVTKSLRLILEKLVANGLITFTIPNK
jgi:Sec7-like guanine-nucleotide exchange factor